MKPTLLFATLSMVFATPSLSAKSELEILRAKCAEQERQIRQLEEDNSKLRSNTATPRTSAASESIAKTADAPDAGITPGNTSYVVKAGDSLEKIAGKLSTSPETLAKVNGLKTNAIIQPGQKLKVPGSTTAVTASKEPAAPAKTTETVATIPGKTYTIRDNDTFSSISRKQKISVDALMAANPKVKPTSLYTGQVINLSNPTRTPQAVEKTPAQEPVKPSMAAKSPVPSSSTPVLASKAPAVEKHHTAAAESKPAASPAPAAPATSEPAPSPSVPQQAASTPSPERKVHPITIEGEMTYEEFAAKHGTNPERLNALNGLDLSNATVLAKGSELYVPAQP